MVKVAAPDPGPQSSRPPRMYGVEGVQERVKDPKGENTVSNINHSRCAGG